MRCNLKYTCTVKWQQNHAFRLPGPAPALLKWSGERVVAREARCSISIHATKKAMPQNAILWPCSGVKAAAKLRLIAYSLRGETLQVSIHAPLRLET